MRPWGRALGWALTGELLELADAERAEPEAIVGALREAGWDATRVAAVAAGRRESEQPWPFPPHPALYAALASPASYHAALAECERLLGADGLSRAVLADRPLDPRERALLADVPPHFGRAG